MMYAWLIDAFQVLNSGTRVGILLIVVWKLVKYRHQFNGAEKAGLGLAGGPGFLTIPAIWNTQDNPFEYWAGAMFSLGVFVYLCGRMSRHIKHKRNNTAMVEQAVRHFNKGQAA